MGVENNNKLSSAPSENTAQKGIIELLKTQMPLVDKQGFSALKPEVQNALEKLIRKVLEKGNKADREKLEDSLCMLLPKTLDEVKLLDKSEEKAVVSKVAQGEKFKTEQEKSKAEQDKSATWIDVSNKNKTNIENIKTQIELFQQFQSTYPSLFAKYFPNGIDASKLDKAQLIDVKNKVGAMLSELIAQAKQSQKPQDIVNVEKFLESFSSAGLIDDRKYVELRKEIDDMKRGMSMVPTPKGLTLPEGKWYTKIGEEYMRFSTDGSVITLKEKDGVIKKEITNAAGFKMEVPMDADNKKDELLKKYAQVGEKAYYLGILQKGEKALGEIDEEIEKCKKSGASEDAKKVEQLEANKKEIQAQTETLRAMFSIEKNKPTSEVLRKIETLLTATKAEMAELEMALKAVPVQTDKNEEQAKKTLKIVEDLGLTFLSNENSHLLLKVIADRAYINLDDGVSVDEKMKIAQAIAVLVGKDVKKLYPDYGADNDFKTVPPYILDGLEMDRDEYLRRTISKSLLMSSEQMLTGTLDYNVVAKTLEQKSAKQNAEQELSFI